MFCVVGDSVGLCFLITYTMSSLVTYFCVHVVQNMSARSAQPAKRTGNSGPSVKPMAKAQPVLSSAAPRGGRAHGGARTGAGKPKGKRSASKPLSAAERQHKRRKVLADEKKKEEAERAVDEALTELSPFRAGKTLSAYVISG